MPVKVTMRPDWEGAIETGLNASVLEMMTDVHRRAIIIAPKDTRALVNSGVIERIINGYRVKFGSSRVPYAKRRHFENKKNPQTLGYLAKAGDSVIRGGYIKYFNRIVKW